MALLFYTTYISSYHAHHEVFHAKVGKGGINTLNNAIFGVTFPDFCQLLYLVWFSSISFF